MYHSVSGPGALCKSLPPARHSRFAIWPRVEVLPMLHGQFALTMCVCKAFKAWRYFETLRISSPPSKAFRFLKLVCARYVLPRQKLVALPVSTDSLHISPCSTLAETEGIAKGGVPPAAKPGCTSLHQIRRCFADPLIRYHAWNKKWKD